jgi:hypothetical protein
LFDFLADQPLGLIPPSPLSSDPFTQHPRARCY